MNNVKQFQRAVDKYTDYFGLVAWEILTEEFDNEDARGSCAWDRTAGMAKIFYDKGWISQEDLTYAEIHQVAFHECLEIYCGYIFDYVMKHDNPELAQEFTHKIIRMLENKLLPLILEEE